MERSVFESIPIAVGGFANVLVYILSENGDRFKVVSSNGEEFTVSKNVVLTKTIETFDLLAIIREENLAQPDERKDTDEDEEHEDEDEDNNSEKASDYELNLTARDNASDEGEEDQDNEKAINIEKLRAVQMKIHEKQSKILGQLSKATYTKSKDKQRVYFPDENALRKAIDEVVEEVFKEFLTS